MPPAESRRGAASVRAPGDLSPLLEPAAIAVLGASADPSRIGGRPVSYLKAGGFAGPIYPVNPKYETVQGLPAYASIRALPGPVNLAILALPAARTLEAVRDCAEAGVRGCVIFSAGFAETGAEGAALQREIAAVARAGGMRVLGPNCLGLFNTACGLYATFTNTLDRGLPRPGNLSIVSQSGAFGSHLYYLAQARGLGLRCLVTTGNECDVQMAECLRWLADDPETAVILAYAEGVADAAPLLDGLERARANRKPVVFMKVGRSEVGAAAVGSHTAALAGTDAVYDAVFRQYGVHRAQTIEGLVDVAYACDGGRFAAGRRLGLVTISGGVGVLMADAAAEAGLEVPPLPAPAQAKLKALLPFASVRNPVDITAQAYNDMSLVEKNLEIMLAEGGYDALLAFFTSSPGSAAVRAPLRRALAAVRRAHPERLIVLSMAVPEAVRTEFEAEGFPVFTDPSHAVAAIAALAGFARHFAGAPPAGAIALPAPRGLPPGPLGEHQAKARLAAAGVPVLAERLATTPEAALDAFAALGGPVALKLVSPDIPHKTEIGGVLLDVADAAALREGYELLARRAREAAPQAHVEGILVAPMRKGGIETIIGVQHDPTFGPVVMFGLGGLFVETLNDVSLRLAPFDEAEALAMIRETRAAPLLDGARGRPRADLAGLAATLAAVSRFAAAEAASLESLDINPFLVLPEDQGGVALDALIVGRPAPRG